MKFVDFPDDKAHLHKLVGEWNALEEGGFEPETKDPYELQRITNIRAELWKEFLIQPAVIEELELDLRLKQRAKIAMLTNSLDSTSKSTGVAQLLNTMMNSYEKNDRTEDTGPAFIYTFVPLNDQQKNAPNVQILEENVFKVD